jgi:hypothetical protein
MRVVRIVLVAAIAAGFAGAILLHEESGVMALGLAPLAWLAVEGIWRLLDPPA